jgi:hypothetical protein
MNNLQIKRKTNCCQNLINFRKVLLPFCSGKSSFTTPAISATRAKASNIRSAFSRKALTSSYSFVLLPHGLENSVSKMHLGEE